MYLVEPSIFKIFIDKNDFDNKIIPKPNVLPCIFVFNSGDVLKAKIETKNFDELLNVIKFNRLVVLPENKYWIRGNEWKVNAKGEKIKVLEV